ncbi:hypothetical protein D3C81_1496420 [compost metagenome]
MLRAQHACGSHFTRQRIAIARALELPRHRHRCDERIHARCRAFAVATHCRRQPRKTQRLRRQRATVDRIAAGHLTGVPLRAEVFGQQAGKHPRLGLGRYRIGQCGTVAITAQDRQAIGRHAVIGLHIAREIFDVAR